MKRFVLLAATLSLGGCLQLKGQPPSADFYTLDTRYLTLCQGSTHHCQDLSVVAPGIIMADPIEKAYGEQITGPNYPLSLAKILMKPADQSYSARQLDDSGRYYALPVNSKTDTAWNTLNKIHTWIYDND